MIELNQLRGPHLMLTNVATHNGFAAREAIDLGHQVLRLDLVGGEHRLQRMRALPFLDLSPPGGASRGVLALHFAGGRFQFFQYLLQNFLHVADDRHIGRADLAHFSGIDVHVDHLGVGREGGEASGHAIVEARAEGDQKIGLGHAHVGGVAAVHSGHADEIRMHSRAIRPAPSMC